MKKRPILSLVILVMVFPMIILAGNLGCTSTPSEEDAVRVTYNANGGSVLPLSDSVPAGKGGSVSLPEPTCMGYFFDGWYTAASGGTRVGGAHDNYVVNESVTLYAQWIPGVIIYYSPNGGTVSTRNETVLAGSTVILPEPTRNGYVFNGWYNRNNVKVGIAGTEHVVQGDTEFQGNTIETLTARWRIIATVTFNVNGGNATAPSDIPAPAESSIKLPSITSSGYTFSGWYTAPISGTRVGGAGDDYVIPIDAGARIILYAQWTAGEVTVTYNANGGSVSPDSETIMAKDSVILPTPTRDGYIFSGWFSAPSSGTRVGGAGSSFTVEVDVTLYAQWTPS